MADTTGVVAKRIGPNLRADEHVVLGYLPGRNIPNTDLEIGANAQVRAGTIIYGGTVIGDDWERLHWYASETERDKAFESMARRHGYYRKTDAPAQVLEKVYR